MSTILLISPEPWDGHFVSKHHYALELSRRGHRVLFHGPAEPIGDICLDSVSDACGILQVLHAPPAGRGLRFLPACVRRRLEASWLTRVELALGQPIDVVWSFENSRFFDMSFAGERLKIYQQVDLNQDFHPELAAETADISIAISEPIARRLASFSRKLIRITHGYCSQDSREFPFEGLQHEFADASVNAVMVGNLDIAYLDVQLLVQLVSDHPDVKFHFVGGYTPDSGLHGLVGSAPNVRFWGLQPARTLPSFLKCADILLVAYLAEDYRDQLANPHKMMEYLASGRCILATRTLEYEDRPDLVETVHSRTEYRRRFALILEDPSIWNSPDKVAIRQEFANANTYADQLERIAQAVGERSKLIS